MVQNYQLICDPKGLVHYLQFRPKQVTIWSGPTEPELLAYEVDRNADVTNYCDFDPSTKRLLYFRNEGDEEDFEDVDILYNTLSLDMVEALEDRISIVPPSLVKVMVYVENFTQ